MQVPIQIIPLVPSHIITVPNNTPLPFPMPVIELPQAGMYPIGIPTLPGQPVYRLPSVSVALTAVPAAALKAAIPAKAALSGAAVNAQASAFSKASASLSKKGEKLPSAERLQALFDGSSENDAEVEAEPVWADSSSQPQTLPEEDLLREMGL
jgi:hypothetical protein